MFDFVHGEKMKKFLSLFNCSERKYLRRWCFVGIAACLSVNQSLHEGVKRYIQFDSILLHFTVRDVIILVIVIVAAAAAAAAIDLSLIATHASKALYLHNQSFVLINLNFQWSPSKNFNIYRHRLNMPHNCATLIQRKQNILQKILRANSDGKLQEGEDERIYSV
jgi:hypothetical protein